MNTAKGKGRVKMSERLKRKRGAVRSTHCHQPVAFSFSKVSVQGSRRINYTLGHL